jgi:hypothetical protein
MPRKVKWKKWAPYGLVTAVGIVLAIPFVATDNLFMPTKPRRCYIVHQLKDGSCPAGYVSEREIFSSSSNCPPRFTEADGRKEYACMDVRAPDIIDEKTHTHLGVGLEKEPCTDFLRRGEKENDTCTRYVIWN